MMSSVLLILIGAVGGVTIFTLIRLLVKSIRYKRKSKVSKPARPKSFEKPDVSYIPTGRVGYVRVFDNGYHGIIIVEEIDRIDSLKGDCKVKIKILDVTVDYKCYYSEADILHRWGSNVWCSPKGFIWNEKTEAQKRDDKIDGLVGNK